MLVVFRAGLEKEDFERVRGHVGDLPYEIRWTRRRDRLVLQIRRAAGDEADVQPLVSDDAVEYVLRGPTNAEIGRLFTRRDLLDLALASTGLITAGAVLAPLGMYLAAESGEGGTRGDVFVAHADAIDVGDALARVVGEEEWIVIRRDATHYHALSATCTHSEVCLVAWDARRGEAVCPCHRGVFDVYGNVVSGPPPRPLEYREVIERDGDLFLARRKP